MEGEGDVTITDVGKKAIAAASYRGRDAAAMCRRGESLLGTGEAMLLSPIWGR